MSEKLGIVALEAPRTTPFLPIPAAAGSREYSDDTARLVDEEIKNLLIEAQKKVREILAARRPALEESSQAAAGKGSGRAPGAVGGS